MNAEEIAMTLRAYARDARRPPEPGEDLAAYLALLADKLDRLAAEIERDGPPKPAASEE